MNYIGQLAEDKEIIEGSEKILIYGVGYGKKIYRNLMFYDREKNVEAFIDNVLAKGDNALYDVPIISTEEAKEKYKETVVCIGGEKAENIKGLDVLQGMKNIHQIIFNENCDLYGTEYGGFYIPCNFKMENRIVYSFGIGEDLSFSEAIIRGGGEVYAFDPTPKSIKFVESHKLISNPKFHFFPYGLSDFDGREVFYLPIRDDWVSASVVLHGNVNNKNIVEVEMRTLRTIMNELGHGHVDVLKMDIEGSEFKVIDNLMNPKLKLVDFSMLLMELHERFFPLKGKEYTDRLFNNMRKNGFYDFYGTDKEPTFIKQEER